MLNTLTFRSRFGEFTIELLAERAPVTCDYFRGLARTGALDNPSVIRIVANANHPSTEKYPIHIVQIGPAETFSGARHSIEHESTDRTGLSHRKWTVSAARFDLGKLYSSFFVCLRDEPELDYGGNRQPDGQGFAAFGRVIDGFDTIEQIFDCAEPNDMLTEQIPIQEVSLSISHTTKGPSRD